MALLQGKVAAITGGVTGIGRATVIEFVKQGAKVAVNHLGRRQDEEDLRCLCKAVDQSRNGELGASPLFAFAGDIAGPGVADEFLQSTVRHFGRLDIVVANAGIARFHDFLSAPDELIEQHLQVNVAGTYYTVRAAGRILKRQGHGGSIIGISSVSALNGSKDLVHYTPTKAAVLNLMQSSAVALGPYEIRCNAILPGTIRTQLNVHDLEKGGKADQVAARTALGRVGAPQDIAGPAVFLASDLSKYVVNVRLQNFVLETASTESELTISSVAKMVACSSIYNSGMPQIALRSPFAEATSQSHDSDGFFKAEDVLCCDGQFYFVVSRASANINTRCLHSTTEQVRLMLPCVSQVAVTSVDGEEFGQGVAAIVAVQSSPPLQETRATTTMYRDRQAESELEQRLSTIQSPHCAESRTGVDSQGQSEQGKRREKLYEQTKLYH